MRKREAGEREREREREEQQKRVQDRLQKKKKKKPGEFQYLFALSLPATSDIAGVQGLRFPTGDHQQGPPLQRQKV